MKREEKKYQTKRRIIDGALAEFSQKGYGASSVNTICSAQGISKGIIYHYFRTKDDLYLTCIEECFCLLTEYLKEVILAESVDTEEKLSRYFIARIEFFTKNPVYRRIFCEAVIEPPAHLKRQIQEKKEGFDALNFSILEQLLSMLPLRPQITKDDVIETFRQFQDFINAKYQVNEFEEHEKSCKRALDIFLYGVIERKENM